MIRRLLAAAALAVVATAYWWRKNPSACPYGQRFWVEAPHPLITRGRLREALAPDPGERVLEIGPGTGYYTVDLARWLGADGAVEIFDIQQEMLDHTLERAREGGVANVHATLGDARSLPYEDDSYDAAILITTLGEIADQDVALREVNRVLKPGGRLIVGELFGDPHMVTHAALTRRAEAAGLPVERKLGGALWHFTRLQA